MKEIREIFETVRTYCGMIFGENRAAKFVKGVRTIRRKDDKSETEKVVLVASSKEQKSIEDWAYLPNKTANLLVTDAMQGFSLLGRELERGVEDKYRKNSPLSRISNAHSSSQRTATSSLGEVNVTTSDNNLIQLQGKKNNSTETDQASMPLGILASKSVSHKANVGGVGTPPYVAKSVSLSDWQIRPTALKLPMEQRTYSLAQFFHLIM